MHLFRGQAKTFLKILFMRASKRHSPTQRAEKGKQSHNHTDVGLKNILMLRTKDD